MITVRNVVDKIEKIVLRGHTGAVLGLAVAPDGSWLASVGRDLTARVWNLADGSRQAVVHQAAITSDIAVAPDGSWLVNVESNGAVWVFDPLVGREWAAIRLDTELRHCVVNPVRPQVVVAGGRHVYFLDIAGVETAIP